MIEKKCAVISINQNKEEIYKIKIQKPEGVEFKAGQYLNIILGDQTKVPYTIASAPEEKELELHIKRQKESLSDKVIKEIETKNVNIEMPFGDAIFKNNNNNKIIIAGGTGLSYGKSIVDHALNNDTKCNIFVICSINNANQIYTKEVISKWNDKPNVSLIIIDGQQYIEEGKSQLKIVDDLVGTAVKTKKNDEADIYIAGNFVIARLLQEKLIEKNIKSENIIGDAF